MSSEDEQPINIERIDNRRGYLALPFDEEQFKDFLISLLGKPQKIERIIRGAFEVHLSDIQNFHYLIEQRINQQNEGKLLQFRAKIIFEDDSSVELNSFSELETYNEIRPIISTAIELSWDYLILFRDKKVPEKQTINIVISSGKIFDYSITPVYYLRPGQGFIKVEIFHTARTWAADMEAMLMNHINTLLKKPNKIREWIKEHDGSISLLIGVLFFLISTIGSFWAIRTFNMEQISTIGKLINSSSDATEKINILASHIISGTTAQYYFYVIMFLVFSLFLSIVFASWVGSNIVPQPRSFVLLTKKAVEERDKILEQYERKWRGFIFSSLLSILTSSLTI